MIGTHRALLNVHNEPIVILQANGIPVFVDHIFKQQELVDGGVVVPPAFRDEFQGLSIVYPPTGSDVDADAHQAELYIKALEWYVDCELKIHGFHWEVITQP